DNGNVGEIFIHNPNAFDIEGDSLAYEQIFPFADTNTIVDDYSLPENTMPIIDPTAFSFLNPFTGEYRWQSPDKPGEFNVAFYVSEFRGGQMISRMIRDMQITILEVDNRPPTLDVIDEICVVAGDTVRFDVTADDPDKNDLVQITTTGGPYLEQESPAVFNVANGYQEPPLVGEFFWATTCDHIRDQFYQVVFTAEDNFRDSLNLSTQRTVRIRVIGPPPENPVADPLSGEILVSWDDPYECASLDERFRGFSVWRRECADSLVLDTCQVGLGGLGYTQVADDLFIDGNGPFNFLDTDVERGRCYCYRILGNFSEINDAGFAFNFVESVPSEEVCAQLSRDLPLITNVDVEFTDIATGEIFVQWSKPSSMDLDTMQNPGPYTYRVFRSDGFNVDATKTQVFEATSPTFFEANDTNFVDVGLNTLQGPFAYEVAFIVNGNDSLGVTPDASSIFLSVASTDMTNNLSWQEEVPWTNTDYVVFRLDDGTGLFEPLDTVQVQSYSDTGLNNGQEYCYFIESIGSLSIPGVLDPLLNKSQEACGIPIDTIPPCPPVLEVTNNCDSAQPGDPEDTFENDLIWTNPNNFCADDVEMYNVYYSPSTGGAFQLIETNTFAEDTTLTHQPGFTVAGCYAVTAIDSVGNESVFSNIVCVDNCPIYELPNVFTPNGDGANDLYVPFPYRFIERVDIQIFNRWGQLVFETSDPDINWNGTNFGGQDLKEGVYYYKALVFERRLDGIIGRGEPLSGYIHLIR
ncbi:MAG: gliding motility-associated C-terminal domain-containing protein, partial [Bacteroidota bacterium]